MTNQDPILANQIILGLLGNLFYNNTADAVRDVQGIPLPVMEFKPANRKLNLIVGTFASGASPASKQLFTCTAGKRFMCILCQVTTGTATAGPCILRDGIADSGTKIVDSTIISSAPVQLNMPDKYPLVFDNGIRWDAAEQTANVTYRMVIMGWEELKETSDPVKVTTIS